MYTELHRHLDCSMRTSTLHQWAQEDGIIPTSTSLQGFKEKIHLTQPLTNLSAVLDSFDLFQKVLTTPERIEKMAREVAEDCYLEGIQNAELRFSPSFMSQTNQFSWEDILVSVQTGVKSTIQKYPSLRVGLICTASRDLGVDSVDATVEFFLKHREYFVGLDLAGKEDGFPCRLYESSFKKAAATCSFVTVHAGEGAGAESIWEAIDILGAHRIGHGIACVQDPDLMKTLKEKQICLEMCPTSNWLTRAVKSIEEHPLPQVLRAGIPVSISTDDPGVFASTLKQELALCRTALGLSEQELQQCEENARKHSFIFSCANQKTPV